MHPLDVLMEEHKKILEMANELDEIIGKVKNGENVEKHKEKLEGIVHHFLDAEKHHKREEEVLFPEIENRGVNGPPDVMRMEHEELRSRKKKLNEIIHEKNINTKELDLYGSQLTEILRNHIWKEDNILYPMAREVVPGEEWDNITNKMDKIGYCCFSPHVH